MKNLNMAETKHKTFYQNELNERIWKQNFDNIS